MFSVNQSCSLGLDVSVSRRSRDVFFKHLGLVSVSAKCGKVSVSSRTESQTSRSRLGPQRLVYKWTFKQIFQFLSFSYKTNMGDICFSYILASSFTCFRFVKVALKRSKILVCTLSNDNKGQWAKWVNKSGWVTCHGSQNVTHCQLCTE